MTCAAAQVKTRKRNSKSLGMDSKESSGLTEVRKGDSEFPDEIELNRVRANEEVFVRNEIVDVAERKWVERELLARSISEFWFDVLAPTFI
jgi:hypothetical protein